MPFFEDALVIGPSRPITNGPIAQSSITAAAVIIRPTMSTTIPYRISKDLPLIADADVIVVGGGPGGIGAAVMAARQGARTVLIERYGCLGGMASVGEIHPFMPNHLGGECLDKPIYVQWLTAMERYYPRRPPKVNDRPGEHLHGNLRHISKEAAMLAAEDLCLEAGVQVIYHHQLADVIVKDKRIDALVLLSKSGYSAARAKAYVDGTGDGDLAARSGCEFEFGGPSGHCQPMTLCFKLSHVDVDRSPSVKEITQLYHEARERGEIDCPRENVLMFDWIDPDVIHFNTTRIIHKSGVNGLELSEAEIIGRRQMRQFLAFFRKHVSGYENARLHSVAHHIGVRESRRIRGLAYITREDYIRCAKYPDGIARVRYGIDIHNPDGSGTEHLALPANEWYEIPFGCLVTKDVTNLLVGGRPISVDHAVHSSMRVMPPACTVGQAAGMGAAMASAGDGNAHKVDGTAVRKKLKDAGASL